MKRISGAFVAAAVAALGLVQPAIAADGDSRRGKGAMIAGAGLLAIVVIIATIGDDDPPLSP